MGSFKVVWIFKIECNHEERLVPTTIIDGILNIIVSHKAYSFLDWYNGYHQISIILEDKYKIIFVFDEGTFIHGRWCLLMWITDCQHTMRQLAKHLKAIPKWIYDFMVYNGLDIHLSKLKLCFQKCGEVGVSMNPNKCAFIVFSIMIMGCIIY